MSARVFVSVLCLFAGICSGTASKPPAPTISISVCIPATGVYDTSVPGSRSSSFFPGSRFHVVISNTSTNTVTLLGRRVALWVRFARLFQFSDTAGNRWIAKKVSKGWDHNFPHWWSLKPDRVRGDRRLFCRPEGLGWISPRADQEALHRDPQCRMRFRQTEMPRIMESGLVRSCLRQFRSISGTKNETA